MTILSILSVFVRGCPCLVPVVPCSSVPVRVGPCHLPSSSELVANAALSLLNLCCYLLDRQLSAQAQAFEKEGGFTERLYHRRLNTRRCS
jgi:four helix bundle suffix protein